MKHLFVPFEIARQLKDKGFNEECLAYWNADPFLKSPAFNIAKPFVHEWCLPAPLYQQVIDWLREKHEIYISVNPSNGIMIFNRKSENKWPYDGTDKKFSYYEALNEAIKKAIELV